MRVLVVEDDEHLAALILAALKRIGLTVDHVTRLDEALAAARAVAYQAIVLDRLLPDGDGIEVVRKIRDARGTTPILILSTRAELESRIGGLDAGADDYLAKPFDVGELVARVRALLRRPGGLVSATLSCGNVSFALSTREVTIDGRPLPLPRRELAVLEQLMRNVGRVVSKPSIEEALYGFSEEVSSNSVEVHIHYLRKHLAEAGATAKIETRRGSGYALVPAAEGESTNRAQF
ncbi:MAG: response regulator transcription factor [Rhodospirillales bacterium]|nr:response regulator transcription factor [Rhodospirillales bacterium]